MSYYFGIKKKVFAVMLFGTIVMGGAGCQSAQVQQQAVSVKPVKLEFWTVFDDVDELKALTAKYTAERPYVTINIRQLRAEEVYQRLIEALAEDRGPDIISVRNRWLVGLKSKLSTMPVEVNDTKVQITGSSVNSQEVIIPGSRRLLTVDQLKNEYVRAVGDDVIMDGQIYGLPLSLENMAVFYNKDILDRAGIAEVPRNWKDLQEAIKKITKLDRTGKIVQAGAGLGTSSNVPGFDDLIYILFRQTGLSFVDRQTGHPVFQLTGNTVSSDQEPPAMGVMDFYTSFADPANASYSWNDSQPSALDSFTNGSLAFFFGYSYHTPVIRAKAPQLNFGIAPLFQLNSDNPVNTANYWVQAVTKKSKNQEAAWSVIDYLAHSPVTKEYLDKTTRPTALRTYIAGQLDNPDLSPFVSQALVSTNWYRGTNYDAAIKALGDMVKEWQLPIPDGEQATRWRQNILNRAASKIDQTF